MRPRRLSRSRCFEYWISATASCLLHSACHVPSLRSHWLPVLSSFVLVPSFCLMHIYPPVSPRPRPPHIRPRLVFQSMSLCPPPRMPSPQLIPAPLPSPPAFPRRISSRSRLQLPSHPNEPPIPPRLVGSPLLEKLTHPDPPTLTPKIQKQLWFDGDEFGTRRSGPAQTQDSTGSLSSASSASPPSTPRSASSRRSHRRTSSIALAHRARSHSPPPPQQITLSIPPVPPIPSSAFSSPGARRSVVRTPPATPMRSRPMQILIPDLTASSNAISGGCPSPALRHTSRNSRTSTSASPRRRGLGCESH